VTGLAMTALVAEHRGSVRDLRQSRDELEQRVRERTADLVRANTALQTDIAERSRLAQERERLLRELQVALANVKTLTGLLPICASCKRIRNDQGYWDQVETYITKRSDARFSHGTCPECARRLYPGLFDADSVGTDL
jgi:nitrate/nitrite-specific signal transduction histidine kinase